MANNNHLNELDKREYCYLRNKHHRFKGKPVVKIDQKTLLDAIKNGAAERTGVDTVKKIKSGELGFLERELGQIDRIAFGFKRVYKVNGITYDLDTLFNLETKSTPYDHIVTH